jgi:hypothetical protein
MKMPKTIRGLAMITTLVLSLMTDAQIAQAWAEPAGPLPDAPSAVAQSSQENAGEEERQNPAEEAQATPAGSQAQRTRPSQAPAGAAGAQEGETAGGAASRPAGTAIAPAKQRQTRSLLIKVGMIAAAGAAVGTIFALTRGTSSVPPGAPR